MRCLQLKSLRSPLARNYCRCRLESEKYKWECLREHGRYKTLPQGGLTMGKVKNHVMLFTQKTWYESVYQFTKNYIRFFWGDINIFITLVVSFWGFLAIIMRMLNDKMPDRYAVILILLIAFSIISYKAILKHRTYTPEALKNEPKQLRKYLNSKNVVGNLPWHAHY